MFVQRINYWMLSSITIYISNRYKSLSNMCMTWNESNKSYIRKHNVQRLPCGTKKIARNIILLRLHVQYIHKEKKNKSRRITFRLDSLMTNSTRSSSCLNASEVRNFSDVYRYTSDISIYKEDT